MVDEEAGLRFVTQAMDAHRAWVDQVRLSWRPIFDSYDDNHWAGRAQDQVWNVVGNAVTAAQPNEDPTRGSIHPTQVNLIRPAATSHMSSLYYDGVHVEVEADELPQQGEKELTRARRSAAVEALLNRWLATSETASVVESVLQMSLLYRGGAAYKVTLDPELKGSPLEKVRLLAVPPWECVWDRRTRTKDGLRFIGHLRQEPIEYARRLGAVTEEEIGTATGIADVIHHGLTHRIQSNEDASYLWVLTLDNLTGEQAVKVGENELVVPGERTEWLVTPGTARVLRKGASPYERRDGRPMPDLVPFIAEPVPHAPWDGLAAVQSTYELNSELNAAMSVMAGQFRKDAIRRILTTDDDETSREALNKARDGEVVRVPPMVDGHGTIEQRYHVLDLGPVSDTMLAYVGFLRDGLERSQVMSDLSRGKAGQYMRAETARSLVEYDQATIGRIRKRSDDALAKVCDLFLRVLAEALGTAKLKVVIEAPTDEDAAATTVYDLTADDLKRRWKVQVIDSASTPGVKADKLATFQNAVPVLMELAKSADDEAMPPTARAFARSGFDILASLAGLPPGVRYAQLRAMAPTPAPPPEPEPAPVQPVAPAEAAPPVAPPPPGSVDEALMQEGAL